MPKTTEPIALEEVRHEFFCPSENGGEAARVEGYPHYSDDENGRSKITHRITRCMDCGAQTVRPLTKEI